MKGFYSIWTAPSGRKEFYMQDFEILTMALSALTWRKYNGKVKMYADEKAFDFLQSRGLIELFDDGFELIQVDKEINPAVFWAAGKLFALSRIDEEMAMVDLDLIVWKNLDKEFENSDILVIHREEICEDIYPEKDYFQMKDGYCFPKGFDWFEKPCNTALLYIKDSLFRKEYCKEAIRFMKSCNMDKDNLKPMVFAEQRMIAGLAPVWNQHISSSFPLANDIGDQDTYTHVWGHKNILKFNYKERDKYCKKCLARLKEEFPEDYEWIKNLEEFQEYLE